MFHEIKRYDNGDVRVTIYNGEEPRELGPLLIFSYESSADFYGDDAEKQAKKWVKAKYPSSKTRV